MLARDNRVERLADASIIWMGMQAEAQARPAPQSLVRTLDERLNLRAAEDLGYRIRSWPHALKRVGDGLPDFPAHLGQGVG